MTRENGYYWVQLFAAGPWAIAKYSHDKWYYNGTSHENHFIHAVHSDRIKEPSSAQPWTSFIQDQMNMVFEVIDPNIKVQQIAVDRIIARDYSMKKDVTQPYLCQQFELPEEGSLSALCGEVYEFFKKTRVNYDQ